MKKEKLVVESGMLLGDIDSDDCKSLKLNARKKITIMEGMKVFDITTKKNNANYLKISFWQKTEKIFKGREPAALLKFWKENQYKTLETFLIESIIDETPFSHSMKEIPNEDFIPRFRQQFESEFTRIEAIKNKGVDSEEESEISEAELERLKK